MTEAKKNFEFFKTLVEKAGWELSDVVRSTNRNGDKSIYFSIYKKEEGKTRHATCRISDHVTYNGTHMVGYAGAFDENAIRDLVLKLA